MHGEVYALFAAMAYGIAGVTILKGKETARGDNGVFLSVVLTAALTFALWLGWGRVSVAQLRTPDALLPLAIFAVAGLFSTVLGRVTMYRATEKIGAISASFLRRLAPVFALPFAFLLVSEMPTALAFLGAVLVLGSAGLYLWQPAALPVATDRVGLMLGVGSAAFYAAAYTLRSYGLDHLPDAAFGTFVGALVGCLWFLGAALLGSQPKARLHRLLIDRGCWHWMTAVALSAGQTLQFFALKSAPVVTVTTIGALEVFFSAALIAVLFGRTTLRIGRLLAAGILAAIGAALLVL